MVGGTIEAGEEGVEGVSMGGFVFCRGRLGSQEVEWVGHG